MLWRSQDSRKLLTTLRTNGHGQDNGLERLVEMKMLKMTVKMMVKTKNNGLLEIPHPASVPIDAE
jgi:hypothetical protein